MANEPKRRCWVAIKTCGCCVGACTADESTKERRKMIRDFQREALKEGASVLSITRAEFDSKYRHTMLECSHS